ncbi:2OG-Fe(II) oxygenase [Chitinophaga nivalis]|uniref:2OG-Fe(II) oxygenase n=1 Tax=Chitinophaga nivalis TaxID=2991709 RepID=A0ABT3IIX3_9BACT|nr:2OG-Fe(II) oxygenase [Chitinophaga nivalis]MCW3466405.1 2OG-Fe(II) oxygenase [Chitinophaga nivalis]MCW3483904.1 2OG-Fe(II) oxygenase [Chitinophaga nivalis]
MSNSSLLKKSNTELLLLAAQSCSSYKNAAPFPHVTLDGLFNESMLRSIVTEFPDLDKQQDIYFNNPNELKFASNDESRFGPATLELLHALNAQPFLQFLTTLTGIDGLIPDPYLWGGGLHQIKRGGYLKIHADFNRHPLLNLNRRINLLVYLNEHWDETYGGHFELWDKEMKGCVKSILPVFNRMVIFNTADHSFHGHPDPLTCPPGESRKSIALYYYTNGRPAEEMAAGNRITTDFRSREADALSMSLFNHSLNFITDLTPPLFLKMYKRNKKK